MTENKSLRRNTLILAGVSFGISLALFIPGALSLFENKIFDILSRNLNPPRASERIVIVEVDQNSIDALSKAGNNWPWPRQIYAPILEFLSEADAVLVDILYTEPSFYGQEDDLIFAEGIKKAKNVYLPFFLSRNQKEVPPQDLAFITRFAVKNAGSTEFRYQSVNAPIDVLREHVKGSGNVAMSPDSGDVYRKVPILFTIQGITVPSLTFSYFTGRHSVKVAGETVFVDNIKVPLVDGRVTLKYFSTKDPFKTFSAVDILGASLGKQNSFVPITKEYFKNKVVFIGLTAAGLLDLKPTPVSGSSTGVLINATLFDNLSNKTFIRPVNPFLVVALMLATTLFIVFFVLTHHSLPRNLSVLLSTFVVITSLAGFLFVQSHYLPLIYPIATLTISFIISVAYKLASEGKERLEIKRTFSQYMDGTIVEHVLQNPDIVKPGGQLRWVTVLFADIAGFTTISEKHAPHDTARILHTVFNELTELVITGQGVMDKYIGDCIMAFWGAPLKGTGDEIKACRTALYLIESIKAVNKAFETEGIPPVALRVGLHSGDAIVGNMGSVRLFDYTVIGDTVNTASRLESVNKVFHTKIIISEKTLEKTYGLFLTRDLGPIEVKGKSESVRIFELIGEHGSIDPDVKKKVDLYHEALSFYRKGLFTDSIKHFDTLLEQYPEDGPSVFYKKRCEAIILNDPLTKSWDIIKMTEK